VENPAFAPQLRSRRRQPVAPAAEQTRWARKPGSALAAG
jgi:hypothetical protein